MNPREFRTFGALCPKQLSGISAEIEKLEKQLNEKKAEKTELIRLKEKLLAFKRAWFELSKAIESPYIEISDKVCDNYPFNKAFSEMNVNDWIDGFIETLNNMGI